MIEGFLLTFFIFIAPIFNKNIDYAESIVFYSIPIIISVLVLINPKKNQNLTKKQIITQIILIFLALPSFFFSISISHSYYGFFIFLNILLTINLSLILIKPENFLKWLIRFSTLYSIILISNKFNLIHLTAKPLGDNFIMQYWGHSYFADFLIFSIPALVFSSANPILLIINLAALILTNSRSALFGTILALFLIKPKNKIIKNSLLVFLVLASFLLWTQVISGLAPQKNTSGHRTDYWHQAISGFANHPFIGNGFNTFKIVSNKYRGQTVDETNFAHNSILSLLCDNGIFFTIFLGIIIFNRLRFNFHKNNLFFAIFAGLILDSFFDPIFNSPGMAILSFYILLQTPNKTQDTSPVNKSKMITIFLFILTLIITIHTISRTLSDFYFYKQNNPLKSISFDPLNINPRIQLIKVFDSTSPEWQKNTEFSKKIAPFETLLHENIMIAQGLPQSIPYYNQMFNDNPKGNCTDYLRLANYYRDNNQVEELDKILQLISTNFVENEFPENCAIPISKINYNKALEIYKTNPSKATFYLQNCVKLIPKLSHYRIELANLYWFTNEKEKASHQIEICLGQAESQEHCQSYLDQHKNKNFDLIGGLDIKNYIDSYDR